MSDERPVGWDDSRFIGVADVAPRSEDGALCWTLEPPDDPSRLMPVPCAFAKPVPAIRATAATEIMKRLLIEYLSSRVFIARADNDRGCVMFRVIRGSTDFVC
jgi:hypothetical protein